MENASKALLIAGGVLIGILVMSLAAYFFGSMKQYASNITEEMQGHEVDKFNQQFLNFEGRGTNGSSKPLTVQDIATLINLAQDSKNNSSYEANIEIRLNGVDISTTQNANDWLKNNVDSNIKYKCTEVHINSQTLLVDYVVISKI